MANCKVPQALIFQLRRWAHDQNIDEDTISALKENGVEEKEDHTEYFMNKGLTYNKNGALSIYFSKVNWIFPGQRQKLLWGYGNVARGLVYKKATMKCSGWIYS
eukprot:15361851-Ditylum_brightwellii.AAC.1